MKTVTVDSLNPFKTAVLFLVFNRLETTKKVFESIRRIKPPALYIASDGARTSKKGEDKVVDEVKQYILSNIDWECDVNTLFREDNLGCKYAVSSAIDWFFKNEEMGIILEDDCVPSQSFYYYCEDLLYKFKDDKRVWHISGSNFQDGRTRGEADYYFSHYNHVWGWASWANRWQSYDVEMNNFKYENRAVLQRLWHHPMIQRYWFRAFKATYLKQVDTWDYQWTYVCWLNNGLSISPNKNLVKNIGFGPEATHTTNTKNKVANMETFDISLPIKHNQTFSINYEADIYTTNKLFIQLNLFKRVFSKILRILS